MLDQRWRADVERRLNPIGSALRRAGFTADQITLLGLAASFFTGVAIATGHFGLAAAGLALSGLTDVLDGAVAKAGGTAGPRGAFFDSVADRLSDAVVLGGAAWWLAGEQPHLTLLPFAVAAASMLVSYERAKAEALGFSGNGGLMERAERMALLGVGLLAGILVPVLWLLLAATGLTVVQRFASVWKQAAPAGEPAGARPRGFWVSSRSVPSVAEDWGLWRAAHRPPGDRSRRWRISSRPPRGERTERSRLAQWWVQTRPDRTAVRSSLGRLRGGNRP